MKKREREKEIWKKQRGREEKEALFEIRYFVEFKIFLLKGLLIEIKVIWNKTVKSMNSIKKYNKTYK